MNFWSLTNKKQFFHLKGCCQDNFLYLDLVHGRVYYKSAQSLDLSTEVEAALVLVS